MTTTRTGLDTVRRTLRMVSRFTAALEQREYINIQVLMEEYGLSRPTIKRFLLLYRQEVRADFTYDPSAGSYRINQPTETTK